MLNEEKEVELREKIKFDEKGKIPEDLQQDLNVWIKDLYPNDVVHYNRKLEDDEQPRYIIEHDQIPQDNKLLEEISVIIYQESIKDRKSRGIDTKGEARTIDKISPVDVGNQYKWRESYQLNGKRIPVDKVSLSDTREDSKGETVSYQCDEYCCRMYKESNHVEISTYKRMEILYDQTPIEERNEILYKMLINLLKFDLNATFKELYINFIKTELNNYKLLNNQKAIIDKLFADQEITYAERRNLKRALNIKG